MIYTYTFTDISKRNDFINILTELWYNIWMNTYSKVISSKSDVQAHIIWNWANVKTTNNTITYYELNIEKNIGPDEEYKLNKLFNLYSYSRLERSFWAVIIGWIIWWISISLLLSYSLYILFWFININIDMDSFIGKTLWYIVIFWPILYIMIAIYKNQSKNIEKDNNNINELKQYLINNYLWEIWKKIINKL